MFPYASKRDEGERRAAQPSKPHLPGIGDGMTTFEMAQAAYENPGKVFVGKTGEDQGSLKVFWCAETNALRRSDGYRMDTCDRQRLGYVWEEERTPLRGSYEFEAQANGLGVFTNLPYKFVTDVIRQAVAGHSGNYTASANKTFRVTVNVEEIL